MWGTRMHVNKCCEHKKGRKSRKKWGLWYRHDIHWQHFFPSLWTPRRAKKRNLSVLQGPDPELSQEIKKRPYRPKHVHGGNIGSSDCTVETLTEGQSTRSSVDKLPCHFSQCPVSDLPESLAQLQSVAARASRCCALTSAGCIFIEERERAFVGTMSSGVTTTAV